MTGQQQQSLGHANFLALVFLVVILLQLGQQITLLEQGAASSKVFALDRPKFEPEVFGSLGIEFVVVINRTRSQE